MQRRAQTTSGADDRPVSKREFALSRIRQSILSGEIAPGERLPLRPLAARLGISVMPVRDALRALEAEGLVAVDHDRGASVIDVSQREIVEVVGLRMWIEVDATRGAAPRHTKTTLRAVRAALGAGAKARANDDGQAFSVANRAFHEAVEAPAGTLVTQVIDDLWNRLWQVRGASSLFALVPERIAAAQAEHERVYAALASGDADAAAAEAEHHRSETLRAWREAFERETEIGE